MDVDTRRDRDPSPLFGIRFELRRWPKEVGLPIDAPVDSAVVETADNSDASLAAESSRPG